MYRLSPISLSLFFSLPSVSVPACSFCRLVFFHSLKRTSLNFFFFKKFLLLLL
jgi:hypothetical protein